MQHKKSFFSRLMMQGVYVMVLCAVMVGFRGEAWARAQVVSVQAHRHAGEELLEIQFSEAVRKQKLFILDNPDRVVLDIAKIDDSAVSLPRDYEGTWIRSVRFGQNNPTTSRFVIALASAPKSVSAHEFDAEDGKPFRIVVAMGVSDDVLHEQNRGETSSPRDVPQVSSSFFSFLSHDAEGRGVDKHDHSAETSVRPSGRLPSSYKPSVSVTVQGVPDAGEAKVEKQVMTPALVDISTQNKKTSSHAKGNGKPLIVIDAGHGGKDPGASGRSGEQEKMITLAYAKQLARIINASGRYRAMLTRDGDSFIMLGERVEIARRAGATLFISLHADSAPAAQAEGLSVYTVSETASDKESAKLAESENNADNIAGLDLGDQEKVVADILTDLARRETKNKSTDLAQAITRSMQRNQVRMLKDPHRFAGFRVLKAPDTPSVLIELGFISTPEEAARLKTASHRERIARAILGGVDGYFE